MDGPPSAAQEQPRRSRVRTAYRIPAPAAERRPRRVRPVALSVLAIAIVAAVAAWQVGALDSLLGTAKRPRAAGEASHPAAAQPPRPAAVAVPEPVGEVTEAAPETPAPTQVSGPGGRYVIYVSSHRTETAAIADAAALGELDVAGAVTRAEVGGSGTWYRVRVAGGYPTLQAAQQALEVVKGLSYVGAWIERTPESQ